MMSELYNPSNFIIVINGKIENKKSEFIDLNL